MTGPAGARNRSTSAGARLGVVAALVVVAALSAALGGACSSSASARPTTAARIRILTPSNDAQTSSEIDLRMALTGAVVAPADHTGGISPKEGYIHVLLDGHLLGILHDLTQVISGLKPGTHTLEVAFVATDHRPFANAVTDSVVIHVQ